MEPSSSQVKSLTLATVLVITVLTFGCKNSSVSASTGGLTPLEARTIAEGAYIYGFPIVG